jgi:DNA mismatch repair protein MutL
VADLFYNTPARLKFLKSPGTEFSHILTSLSRQAMAHPSIRFRLTHNKKEVLDLPPSQGMKERVFQLYGSEIAGQVIPFSGGRDGVQVHGLIGRPAYSRADRTYQDFFVNRRAVKNPSLTHALYGAYGDMLMRDRHPVGFIFIEIDPALVDVNVHPAKAEVRFRNQPQVHDLVRDAVREGLRAQGTPVIGTGKTGGVHAEGVREALTGYLAGQAAGSAASVRGPSPLFGRRKSDVEPREPRTEPGAAPHGQPSMAASSPSTFFSGHDLAPLAQVHDSFIIAQSREGMALVDQHAAHERVLFEKLQDQFEAGLVPVQNLLMPDQVELGPSQAGLLAEHLPELDKVGFFVEDFGNGTFVIKAVPSLLAGADYKKLLLDILDEVNVHGNSKKMAEFRDEVLGVMACHPAIKVHRHLDRREMEVLLDDLFRCRMPHTCPHGRPTIIRFSMDEIKKMFKRM